MKYSNVFLSAIGYQLPDIVVSTKELEERIAPVYQALKIPMGQLEFLTGIKERRWWPKNFVISDGASKAAEKALQKAGLTGDDVDILVYAGVCRDYIEPATACKIAYDLGVKEGASVYDISNACLGTLNGLVDVANRIELGQADVGVVVSCESARDINEDTITKLLDNRDIEVFKKSLATLTGGSGAVALVLTSQRKSEVCQHRILGGVTRADSQYHDLCRWGMRRLKDSLFEQFLTTDAVSVMKHGVQLGIRTWQALLAELKWAQDTIDRTISHQVGRSHRASILKALGLQESMDFPTYQVLGNMGTVSLPLSAAIADEKGFLKAGNKVGFLGIGSGLNCMMLGVEW
ncbi:3-oxoacyl-ACP synthase III [Pseudobacteriovorax antillogorgiicola]|uniref:3-oxoacyl-[acyl-carrier-protein] synthase-3 n=1 Tax=Pseudobacteriovorax antillogorgiicola TaxID=1513793 RepID=A0A1Y6C0Z1_9BACT|nr:3-oxoacyl-ACP synthase III [Pseudobacteriovorax antillogorgiicola]TCS52277.1 3-oxoacyl-[acyl-carrier-protein] synthase-3 [Pseudobacteriovorax antillogorgiicola]SMF30733.1 3-oxoacyl-[acyl-carrier-protein] synthase-3 [Pseudobacteriovorax antillogorgiicola]